MQEQCAAALSTTKQSDLRTVETASGQRPSFRHDHGMSALL